MKPEEKIEVIVRALDSKKAVDIKVIKIDELTTIADYFVIATGTSSTQVKSLADEVEYKMTEAGEEPHHTEGKSTGWILLDYISAVVQIINSESREFYNLEHLWQDGEEIDISGFTAQD